MGALTARQPVAPCGRCARRLSPTRTVRASAIAPKHTANPSRNIKNDELELDAGVDHAALRGAQLRDAHLISLGDGERLRQREDVCAQTRHGRVGQELGVGHRRGGGVEVEDRDIRVSFDIEPELGAKAQDVGDLPAVSRIDARQWLEWSPRGHDTDETGRQMKLARHVVADRRARDHVAEQQRAGLELLEAVGVLSEIHDDRIRRVHHNAGARGGDCDSTRGQTRRREREPVHAQHGDTDAHEGTEAPNNPAPVSDSTYA